MNNEHQRREGRHREPRGLTLAQAHRDAERGDGHQRERGDEIYEGYEEGDVADHFNRPDRDPGPIRESQGLEVARNPRRA
jgi:hypothetical protein